MGWLIQLLVNSIVLVAVAGYFESFFLESIWAAILASFLLMIINIFVKPFLIILTLPVTMLTLGFFLFVINAVTLMITAALMGDAFVIDGFGMAVLAAIIIAILNLAINKVIIEPLRQRKR
ncbi:phage holin family protein [Anaerobacillus sp. MEB173]|uniref:phage holin family protein n=1 Tax=Anaerobacillus sp. MEB173 TaxID=3383345 RepID=UPI003F9205A6